MTTARPRPLDDVDDAALALAAAGGDRSAFAAIYDRYADRLHDFCIGMLRDRDAAADCVQDVFVTAATRLAQLREPDRLRSWLYAIARNEALNRIRQRRRELPNDQLPEMDSGEPDMATVAARGELADLISEASRGLSDRDRVVLELAYRQGLDGPELAEALGVTNKNANTLVERLRVTVERSLGALLVLRSVKADPARCPELAALIDWDAEFSVLIRKRAARHIDGCPTCTDERSRKVTPAALLGATPVFLPAPAWLREQTLGQAASARPPSTAPGPAADVAAPDTSHSGSWWPPQDLDTTDLDQPPRTGSSAGRSSGRRGRAALGAGLLILGLAGVVVVATPDRYRVGPVNAPGESTAPAPATATRNIPPPPPSGKIPPPVAPPSAPPTAIPRTAGPPAPSSAPIATVPESTRPVAPPSAQITTAPEKTRPKAPPSEVSPPPPPPPPKAPEEPDSPEEPPSPPSPPPTKPSVEVPKIDPPDKKDGPAAPCAPDSPGCAPVFS